MNKDDYAWYKSHNICVRCRHERAEPNRVICWECIDKEKEYDRKKRNSPIEEYKKRDMNKYNDLKAKGICTKG